MITIKRIYKFSVDKESNKRDRCVEKTVIKFLGIPIYNYSYAEDSHVSKKKVKQGFKK